MTFSSTWPLRPFGELVHNHDSRRVPVRKNDRRPGPYPYYGASGVVDHVDGYLFDGEYLLIAEDGENLITQRTPIAFMATGRFWVNNHAHVVTANEVNDARYLMYAIRAFGIRPYLSGSTRPKLTQGNLNRIQVPAPPLSQQRLISEVLGALDDKIELNRKMNRTLEEIAQVLFRAWFVDFEGETDLVESELGPIPRGWEVGGLEDVAEFLNGVACQRYPANHEEDVLRVIKIRELRSGFSESSDLVGREGLPSQYKVEDGDILFSWSGSLEVKIWTEGPGALNQHIFKVTPIAVPRWFVYFWLLEFLPEFRHIAASKATTMGHIRRRHLQEARLSVPPKSVLEVAGSVIGPLLDRFLLNELQSRTLADLRDTLLPKLISGEIRVPEAQEAFEEAV